MRLIERMSNYMPESVNGGSLLWFRRDLRVDDHAALVAAVNAAKRDGGQVFACFIFDRGILDPLDRADRRVCFIRDSLAELQGAWQNLAIGRAPSPSKKGHAVRQSGVRLIFLQGDPVTLLPSLAARLGVATVFASRDYEPEAKARDAAVGKRLQKDGRRLELVKDQVVFESPEVLTGDGRPFSVFTPYRNAWRKRLQAVDLAPRLLPAETVSFGCPPSIDGELACREDGAPSLADIGFQQQALECLVAPGLSGAHQALTAFEERLDRYREQRDFPGLDSTSRLSVHLRFGSVSVRTLARLSWQVELQTGSEGAKTWLDELIWREFYMAVLDVCPWVVDACWRREYDAILWDDAPELFAAWCSGQTGYPLVDAAMRQLLASGFMHNRARMVVASFLTKDLGIDWRRGERFFARHLLDYDLSANNGGWQWAASTGCDAQPYFRIFNPVTQSQKFDPKGDYIRHWVPELRAVSLRYLHAPWTMPPLEQQALGFRLGFDYPLPVVDHATARERTLARYGAARDQR